VPPSIDIVQLNTCDSSTLQSAGDSSEVFGDDLRSIESRLWRIRLFSLTAACPYEFIWVEIYRILNNKCEGKRWGT